MVVWGLELGFDFAKCDAPVLFENGEVGVYGVGLVVGIVKYEEALHGIPWGEIRVYFSKN